MLIISDAFLETLANEFFLGFTSNARFAGFPITMQIVVTTPESSPISFSVSAGTDSLNLNVSRDVSTVIRIPESLQVFSVTERDKGIYLKAEGESEINVFGLSYHEFTSDAFLALPCRDLGLSEYVYYGVSYPLVLDSVIANHPNVMLLVVACEDNTIVTTPSNTVTLSRLQTYAVQSIDDLTGTKITTTKPVSFFSNHECTFVPIGTTFCDHLNEQLPPTASWGRFYLVASLLGRRSGEVIRMVAAHASTTITVHCTSFSQAETYLMQDEGDFQEIQIANNNFCSIESTAPILVVQFASGRSADNLIGDPFMMIIPPIEQYTNNFLSNSFPTYVQDYLTIYTTPLFYQPQMMFIDNATLNTLTWARVQCASGDTCGYVARVNITAFPGFHRIYHQNPQARLGVSAYGFEIDNSYGYAAPGGYVMRDTRRKDTQNIQSYCNFLVHVCCLFFFSF